MKKSLHGDLLDVVKAHAPNGDHEEIDTATLGLPVGVSSGQEGIQILDWRKIWKGDVAGSLRTPRPLLSIPLNKKEALGLGILLIKASRGEGV